MSEMQKRVCELAHTFKQRPQVFIVEDNEDDVYLLEHVLKMQGCDVVIERDGKSACLLFEQCQHEPFDIIFLDLKLPSRDGVAVLQAAHEAMPHTPCVIITGHPESPLVHDAARLGFVELAAKPLNADTIIRIFNTHRITLPRPSA